MKDKEKYSLVGYGDVRDAEQSDLSTEMVHYDIPFLAYIPDGFEINRYNITSKSMLMKIINQDKYIYLSLDKVLNRAIDTEDMDYVHEKINGRDVLFHYKDDCNAYVLNLNEEILDIFGNISKEELVKIIEGINYEKLEELLQ